jgi:hypothetical protein
MTSNLVTLVSPKVPNVFFIIAAKEFVVMLLNFAVNLSYTSFATLLRSREFVVVVVVCGRVTTIFVERSEEVMRRFLLKFEYSKNNRLVVFLSLHP